MVIIGKLLCSSNFVRRQNSSAFPIDTRIEVHHSVPEIQNILRTGEIQQYGGRHVKTSVTGERRVSTSGSAFGRQCLFPVSEVQRRPRWMVDPGQVAPSFVPRPLHELLRSSTHPPQLTIIITITIISVRHLSVPRADYPPEGRILRLRI